MATQVEDFESFDAFADTRMVELGRLAFSLTGEADVADDLVADALLDAWRRWPTVMTARNPDAYVRRIVINKAATRVRKLVRERDRLRLIGSSIGIYAEEMDPAASIDLRAALEELPRGQRECIILRHVLDLSEVQVAEHLGISLGTVKSQTSKAAGRIRQMLGAVTQDA